MVKSLTIKPKYIWLTSGTGKYSNHKSAMCMAKRSAGIENVLYIPIFNVVNSPFKVLSRKEFFEKLKPGEPLYMYGSINYGVKGEKLLGSMSLLSTEDWGGISYNVRHSKSSQNQAVRSEMSSIRQIISDYESVTGKQAPKPITITNDISCDEDLNYSIIFAAMIIGEPDV